MAKFHDNCLEILFLYVYLYYNTGKMLYYLYFIFSSNHSINKIFLMSLNKFLYLPQYFHVEYYICTCQCKKKKKKEEKKIKYKYMSNIYKYKYI